MGTSVTTALGNTYVIPDDNESDWGESQVGPALIELLKNAVMNGGDMSLLKLVGPLITQPITMTVDSGQILPSSAPLYIISGLNQAVTVSPDIPIQPGVLPGHHLTIIGKDDVRTVTIPDGGTTNLNGPVRLGKDMALTLIWSGTAWVETGRTS